MTAVGDEPIDALFLSSLTEFSGGEASIWKLEKQSALILMASTDIAAGTQRGKVNAVKLTKGQGISGQAVLQRRTLSFPDGAYSLWHDDRVDAIVGKKTRSMISAPIVLSGRCVYGVLNLVNPRSDLSTPALMDTLTIAAQIYAFSLAERGKYDAPTHEELAREFPNVKHAPSSPIADVIEQCKRYAAVDAPILLLGETGTGKELFAKMIHAASGREGNKVDVNCSLLRPERTEDELFGHAKGAFTDAREDKPGKFEAAEKGTIFLDEIGELAQECQPMFLRVMESRMGRRIGENDERPYDARIVAATRRTESELLTGGLLREDLWARLDRFRIGIPPLRERPMDIPLLAEHFIEKYSVHYKRPSPRLSKRASERLQRYPWPRNVRQLENVIAKLVVDYPGLEIGEDALARLYPITNQEPLPPFQIDMIAVPSEAREGGEERTEEQCIREALAAPENLLKNGRANLSRVASALTMDRHTLARKLKKYGIPKRPY
jgi:DNA-binding NtrC family response regulator